jgi:thymidylate synthase (FAD)
MIVIEPYFKIETDFNGDDVLKLLEQVGRTCYKSEDRITDESAEKFIAGIVKSGHEAVIEHFNITVRVVCDRGVSHEIVRHRLGSYAQESTRYCNYGKDKFENQLTFIKPCFWDEGDILYKEWATAMEEAEKSYLKLLSDGAKPEEARAVLPNSLKTELVITMNLREWRHFLKLRSSKAAHPQIREIAIPLTKELQKKLPVIFDDLLK